MRVGILLAFGSAVGCAAPAVPLSPRASELPVRDAAEEGQLMHQHRCALNQTTRENCIAEGRNAAAEAEAAYVIVHREPPTYREKLRGSRGQLAILAYGGADSPLPEWVRQQHIFRAAEEGAEMCAVGVAQEPGKMAADLLSRAQNHARAELITFVVRTMNEVPKGEEKPEVSLASELVSVRDVENAMRRNSPGESSFALACLNAESLSGEEAAALFEGDREKVEQALSRVRSKVLAEAGVAAPVSDDGSETAGTDENGEPSEDGAANSDTPEETPELTKAQRKKLKRLSKTAARQLRGRKYPRATKTIAKCFEIDPNHCECHRTLGIVLSRQGKADEAMPHYEAYLKHCPDGKHAEELRMWVDNSE